MKSLLIIVSLIAVALAHPYHHRMVAPVGGASPVQTINPGAAGPAPIEGLGPVSPGAAGPAAIEGGGLGPVSPGTAGPAPIEGLGPVNPGATGPAAIEGGGLGPVSPGAAGPAPIEGGGLAPIGTGPANIEGFIPVAVGPSVIDFTPENIIDIPGPDGKPLVQIVVNVNAPAAAVLPVNPVNPGQANEVENPAIVPESAGLGIPVRPDLIPAVVPESAGLGIPVRPDVDPVPALVMPDLLN